MQPISASRRKLPSGVFAAAAGQAALLVMDRRSEWLSFLLWGCHGADLVLFISVISDCHRFVVIVLASGGEDRFCEKRRSREFSPDLVAGRRVHNMLFGIQLRRHIWYESGGEKTTVTSWSPIPNDTSGLRLALVFSQAIIHLCEIVSPCDAGHHACYS